jgi:glycosyltransferase involved in cell wall biosynthesis
MIYRELKKMPLGWDEAISNRAECILEAMGVCEAKDSDWLSLTQGILAKKNGGYFVWLAITGCYPNKYELKEFNSNLQVHGSHLAILNLISERLKNIESSRLLARVVLVKPKNSELVDVTHTSTTPFLTGIQRVVHGITDDVAGISTFIWIGSSGVLTEKQMSNKPSKNSQLGNNKSWRYSTVHKLHKLVPVLDKTPIGKRIRTVALPLARKIKKILVHRELKILLNMNKSLYVHNILILNSRITIPEIPSPQHILHYEAIMENSIVPIQVILYDFIPLFHAWTVHPHNRGSLNLYLRIILLADRILSISALVQEQAQLITRAFKLERTEWQSREQSFDYLPLPSGLPPASPKEFKKDPFLIVMAGSLEPRKNHIQFLDAIEILWNRNIPVKAEILGSAGWENDSILDRIYELQSKGVRIGRHSDLSDVEMRQRIGEAQALLQISEAEGFGLPIAEALAQGTQVIVSNISPLKEWVGERVKSVELGDGLELANLLAEILLYPEKESFATTNKYSWSDWITLLYSTK